MRFRVAFGVAIALSLMALFAFGVVYISLAQTLAARADESIAAEWKEFQNIYTAGGLEALRTELQFEQSALGPRGGILLVYDDRALNIASADVTPWGDAAQPAHRAAALSMDTPEYDTAPVPNFDVDARRLHGLVGPGVAVMMVESLGENVALLDSAFVSFIATFAPILVLAVLLAWYLANRAAAGVGAMRNTAVDIASGRLDLRVDATGYAQEIVDLGAAFNTMLDKIQLLMREARETNDNIAHDLRTPIARIRAAAEFLATHRADGAEPEEIAGDIIRECDRLLSAVNTMLDIAEMEAGVSGLDAHEVDLAELVEECCDLFQPSAEEQDIELDVQVSARPRVLGNAQMLRRALSNLLDNAIKYSGGGKPVHISLTNSKGEAHITVVDEGPGIAEGELPRIFDRFYRGDKSRTLPGNGLGLGFAKAAVTAHRGTILMDNAPGQGARVRITLKTAA